MDRNRADTKIERQRDRETETETVGETEME